MDRIQQLAGTKFDSDVVHAIERAVAAGKLKLSPSVVEVEVAVV